MILYKPSDVAEFLALLYVILVPIGWSLFPGNIQWADLAFVGLVVALLVRGRWKLTKLHFIDVLIGLYLLGSALSLFSTSDVARSSVELVKEGYLAVVAIVVSLLARDEVVAMKIMSWYAWVAIAFAVFGLLAVAAHAAGVIGPLETLLAPGPLPRVGDVARIKGALLSPGFFCNYLTGVLPILIAFAIQDGHHATRRRWILANLIISVAAMWTVTYSIIGFLIAGLASVWHLCSFSIWLRRLRMGLAAFLVVLFVGFNVLLAIDIREIKWTADENPQIQQAVYAYAQQQEGHGARRVTLSISYNPMSYGLLKRVAVDAFRRAPITGVGLGTFHHETVRASREGMIHAPYAKADPHCELLGRLAETGLFGLFTLVLLWVGVMRLGIVLSRRSTRDAWVSQALLVGFIGLLVNSVNVDIMHFRFLWIGIGLLRGQVDRAA